MKRFDWRVLLGIVLLVVGVLALLQTLGVVNMQGNIWGAIFAVIFVATGVGFLYVFFGTPEAWWAVIPGLTLVGLGSMMGLAMIPGFPDQVGAALFMGCIGASFWVIYARNKAFWWAIIPGGTLVTLALIILLGEQGKLVPAVLFGGMAATFALLAFLGQRSGQPMSWPWIPAAVLAVMALIFFATSGGPLPEVIWAVVLILAGGFLLGRSFLLKK